MKVYSHLGGAEILQVKYPSISEEIDAVIRSIKVTKDKKSKEQSKRIAGKMLYGPRTMNKLFRDALRTRGFDERRFKVPLEVGNGSKVIPSFKQVDFVKDKVFVEVQFGKYTFMAYDLSKFQYFFSEGDADVGVEIVPAYTLTRSMSSGVSYGEQLITDIERMKRHFPAVPVKIILIDADVESV